MTSDDSENDGLCMKIGPVFNPLQDPAVTEPTDRGTIDDWTVVIEEDDIYEITQ